MRTHLLRTFYPPAANEPETGAAANDEAYDRPLAEPSSAARVLALVLHGAGMPSREDEYALGGYAGI